jgi:hypothetical protein
MTAETPPSAMLTAFLTDEAPPFCLPRKGMN